jgi:archaemetzincin
MKVGILTIGKADANLISRIQENLTAILAKTSYALVGETLQIPEEAFSRTRKQYRSDTILEIVRNYAERQNVFNRVLGIVDVDLFVPRLNFVFGQAECPGNAALISLWRLRPEFYGKPSDTQVLAERSTKEALHELGHTLGLKHCSNPFCVMYFSNSIFETDRKQSLFCNKCYLKAQTSADKLR